MQHLHIELIVPALSLFCGVSPAQEHRCLEELKTDISLPISPIIAIAVKISLIFGNDKIILYRSFVTWILLINFQ
jgi:hypothetical protein